MSQFGRNVFWPPLNRKVASHCLANSIKAANLCLPRRIIAGENMKIILSLLLSTILSCQIASTSSLNTNVCIDVGEEEMTCTREVLETRTRYDDASINVGVTQRIDGSDSEKQAVRDVLKHMDDYFFHEVLALPEYDHARSRW